MEVKATDVKKLREKTGAGILDCKKALTRAEGDFNQAEKILKELGLAAATKRSGRSTNEGRIFSIIKNSKGGLLELSCETDFVARNSDFITFGQNILEKIVDREIGTVTEELKEQVNELAGKIKENINIRRFKILKTGENEFLTDYIHGEGRIGVLVKLEVGRSELLDNSAVKEFAFDCALHIAAFNPKYLSKDRVEEEYLKEQEEIFTKQVERMGKPEKVIPGIVKGKLNKHFSEICLLDQGFVKDEKQTVSQVLKSLEKEVGGSVNITDYLYYRVGEEL